MANCILGGIISPQNNYIYNTLTLPISIPLVINSPTEPSNFLVQVSNNPLFITQNAQITNSTGSVNINIGQTGTYYLRISCDGNSWSGSIVFTVEQSTTKDLSSINRIIATLNGSSFDIIIPQLIYGPSFIYNTTLNQVIYSNGNINNIQMLEIQASQDTNFITNVYYQLFYPSDGLDTLSLEIPNMISNTIYYIRARIYVNNEWEAYTNSQQSTTVNT